MTLVLVSVSLAIELMSGDNLSLSTVAAAPRRQWPLKEDDQLQMKALKNKKMQCKVILNNIVSTNALLSIVAVNLMLCLLLGLCLFVQGMCEKCLCVCGSAWREVFGLC